MFQGSGPRSGDREESGIRVSGEAGDHVRVEVAPGRLEILR